MHDKRPQHQTRRQEGLLSRTRFAMERELPNGIYRAVRAAARVLIPHSVRWRVVRSVRSGFGMLLLYNLITDSLRSPGAISPTQYHPDGDKIQDLNLSSPLLGTEANDVLDRSLRSVRRTLPDIISFSIIDWSFRFQRPQQVMSQFAANGHRVFYISVSKFRSRYARPRFALFHIASNIFEVQLASPEPLDIFRELVEGKKAEVTLGALNELRRELGIFDAVSYVMMPSWSAVALEARSRWGWHVAYDCMDDWDQFPGVQPASIEAEAHLVEECDLLLVTSSRLADKWKWRERPAVLARNAADFEFFAEGCRPNSLLPAQENPIIGYFGAIAEWVDLALLADVASCRPDYTFVLVGGTYNVDTSRLQGLSNVRLLGQQPYGTMPQYLHHFDVGIIPFQISPITHAADPVKLYEYFAGGKPVVSTRLAELERSGDLVYLAENATDFAMKLDLALAERDPALPARRRAFARDNTWIHRYQQIIEGLRYVHQTSPPRVAVKSTTNTRGPIARP